MKHHRLKYCDWLCFVYCDWLCTVLATGVREMLRPVFVRCYDRRGKRCALFCVLRLDDQQLVLRIEHPMRRRLDKLVRRRFEDQSMVCFVIEAASV
ncbi:axial regulator YABBY 1-like [Dorcoceras hygrometricum]|uniref:Axial regulator YABBY 1-like n=1 Tax=Dorcoceras hygrometricum TaxID=472368 RepID=A0A2Z7APH2_9LAMI|nr:axial regulator YABBY 1-like [Dorcoceras hygrometricum]